MHESGLMRGVVRQLNELAQSHGCKSITAVKLSIRDNEGSSADHFAEHFRAASAGSCAQDAQLDIEVFTDDMHVGRPQITIVSIEVPA